MHKNIFNLQNLDNFINTTLKPKLLLLEKRRQTLLFLAFSLSLFIIVLCVVFAKLVNIDGKSLGALIFTSILPYLLITEKYKLDIQKKVMNIFMSYFENLQFMPDEVVPDYKIVKSNLFNFTQNIADIGFYGTINNQKIIISLPKLKFYDQKTQKNELVFEGIMAMSLINQHISSQVTLANNADVDMFNNLPRVPNNKLFVFSNDTELAQSLLTNELSEWFLSIKDIFKTEKYALTFFENTALIAIYSTELKFFNYKSTYQKIRYNDNFRILYNYLLKLLELNSLLPPLPEQNYGE